MVPHHCRISRRCLRVNEKLRYQSLHSIHHRPVLGINNQEIILHSKGSNILQKPQAPVQIVKNGDSQRSDDEQKRRGP